MTVERENWYLSKEEPVRSCLLALRDIILAQDMLISETVKYGMPCFIVKKKILCYLWTDKKTDEPYILVVDGKLIDHLALEAGDRARMKILRIDPDKDLPVKTIREVLNLALDLYRKGATQP